MAKKSDLSEGKIKKSEDVRFIFKELDEINPDGSILSESALSQVDEWIDNHA